MEEVLVKQLELHQRLVELNASYVKSFGFQTDSVPISAFNMACNRNIMSHEIFTYYWHDWGRAREVPSEVSREVVISENWRRLSEILISQLIAALSGFEFCSKAAILVELSPVPNKGRGRTYLSYIFEQSYRLEIISEDDFNGWSGLIELRNCYVHNNAYSDRDFEFTACGYPAVKMLAGKQPKISLAAHFEYISWSIEAYARWCNGMFNSGGDKYVENLVRQPIL
ncbi:hypothetical protein [Pseudomonas sp. S32]|uniref:hypothetical protein n=1 Tax=Pseudomonas sp. S32 TaxID=2767448 RepID=UPI0019112BAC|nr:hypothetical protein [Pseudomonas sp. S32]MBK5004157.1 hypothetical protein [Pseudomonas sp. S32]